MEYADVLPGSLDVAIAVQIRRFSLPYGYHVIKIIIKVFGSGKISAKCCIMTIVTQAIQISELVPQKAVWQQENTDTDYGVYLQK